MVATPCGTLSVPTNIPDFQCLCNWKILTLTPARHLDVRVSLLFHANVLPPCSANQTHETPRSPLPNGKLFLCKCCQHQLLKLNFAPSGKLCTQPFAQPLPVNFWSGLACRRSPAALRNPMWNEARNGPGENMATTGEDKLILDHIQRKAVFQLSRFRCHISIGQCNLDGATGTILPERLKRVW